MARLGSALGKSRHLDGHQTDWSRQFWAMVWERGDGTLLEYPPHHRGAKVKKKLEIDPLHAETIRLIYRLALEGEGSSGQMGVKAIVKFLNGRGIFTRDGGR
jgi:hypothetical protein